jgi:hypothetical protein
MAHIDLDLDIFVYSEFDILLLSDVELARIAQANRFNSFRFSTPAITAHRQVLNRRRLVEDNRRRVRDCIQTREDWLTSKNFPKDMKMRTDERAAFVKHCKDKFHAEPDQLRQQQRDFAEGGAHKQKQKKKLAVGAPHANRNGLQTVVGSCVLHRHTSFSTPPSRRVDDGQRLAMELRSAMDYGRHSLLLGRHG